MRGVLQMINQKLRSTIGERNRNPGRSEIEIFSVMDGHQFSPPKIFAGA